MRERIALIFPMTVIAGLAWATFGLPGSPSTPYRKRSGLNSAEDFRRELVAQGVTVSESIVQRFAEAVEVHLQGDFTKATRRYRRLASVDLAAGQKDLRHASFALQYNLRLAESRRRE